MALTPTTRPYERAHGRRPRGEGGWAFQRSRTREAFTPDLYGPVVQVWGLYSQARAQAARDLRDDQSGWMATQWMAVLP